MSLTDDWKAGKLKKDWYFIKLDDVIYSDYYNGYFIQTRDTDGIEVLAPCDYEELQQLKTENEVLRLKVAELEKELENAHSTKNWANRRAKHLLDLQKEEDKEVERLRELLKECAKYVRNTNFSNEYFMPKYQQDLLIKINAAIGESEE